MATTDDEPEDELLRSASLQNARSILEARQRTDDQLRSAKEALENKTTELARSVAMLRATLESTTDGILVTDFEGRITEFNQHFADMWQLPLELMERRDHRQLLIYTGPHLARPREFLDRIEEIYADSPPETHDLLELADGRLVERFSRIQTIDGINVGRVWSFRDITAHRRSERELRERAQLAAMRADLAGVLAGKANLDVALQRCCELLLQHLEATTTELWIVPQGETSMALRASAGRPRSQATSTELVADSVLTRVVDRRQPLLCDDIAAAADLSDLQWMTRQGAVGFAGYPLVVEGRCFGVLAVSSNRPLRETVQAELGSLADAIAHNVDRRRAVQALAASEARKAAILDTALDSIITCDGAGHIISFNPAAEVTFGYRRAEVLGRDLADLIIPERLRDRLWAAMSRLQQTGQSTVLNRRIEMVAQRSDGSEFPVELAITQIVGVEPALFTAYIRDITASRRAADALRQQSEWLRVTLASIGDAVVTTDELGRVASLNPVAETLTGWSDLEARGRPIDQVFTIVDQAGVAIESPSARALRERRVVGMENPTALIARDGTRRAIDDSAAPIRDDDGNVLGVVLIFRDITNRRRDEQRLRDSEAKFRQLADAQPQIVWTARADGVIDYFNERWYEFTGFARASPGDPVSRTIVHPDDLEPSTSAFYESIRTGEPYQIELRFQDRKTGGYRWFLARATPVRDEHGEVVRWFGTSTDIDDTKKAQETTRFLADASAALAELTDYESTLQRVAGLAVPFFADWCAVDMLDEHDAVRRLAVAHVEPAKVQLAKELFQRYPPLPSDTHGSMKVLRSGEPEWAARIPDELLAATCRDAEHLRICCDLGLRSYICVPMKSHTKVFGTLTFVTAESGRTYTVGDLRSAEDLAHRAVLAIESSNLLAALQMSDRRKDEFLAMLAHELRNPLAPMRNAIQVIRAEAPATGRVPWAAGVIDRQTAQMTRLVDDLLDVSRITRGRIELRNEPIVLGDVVTSAVEDSQPLIDSLDHELTVSLPAEPIHLTGDPTRLGQVVLNLLNNAAKYTDNGGHIWLSAQRAEGEVVIRVKDTGVGIARHKLPEVFELFSQVDRTLERSQSGLGLGLTLVKRIVELHGGSVEAHSPGLALGSEFIVRLPVEPRGHTQTSPHRPDDHVAATQLSRRILVVDDNRDAADSMAMLLSMEGNDVRTAYDGPTALTEAASFRPAVALLDIGLPGLDGYAVARQIRPQAQAPGMVLIALTGWGHEADRRRSKEAGFDHHLTKPVDFEQLRGLIDTAPDAD